MAGPLLLTERWSGRSASTEALPLLEPAGRSRRVGPRQRPGPRLLFRSRGRDCVASPSVDDQLGCLVLLDPFKLVITLPLILMTASRQSRLGFLLVCRFSFFIRVRRLHAGEPAGAAGSAAEGRPHSPLSGGWATQPAQPSASRLRCRGSALSGQQQESEDQRATDASETISTIFFLSPLPQSPADSR